MADKATKKPAAKTVSNQFVENLIKQHEADLQAVERASREVLNENKYYDLDEDGKVEFLCSKKGQAIIQNLAKKRISFANIADALAFSQKKLHALARDNDEIYDAIDRGRASELDEVEQTLYKLANGYTITERKTITQDSGRGREPIVTIQDADRYIAPNFFAQKYLLEQKRQMEYQADQARQNMELNRVNLEIVVIGEDEIKQD